MAIETLMAHCERDPVITRSVDPDRVLGELATALTELLGLCCDHGFRRQDGHLTLALWVRWGMIAVSVRHQNLAPCDGGHGATAGSWEIIAAVTDDILFDRVDGVDVVVLEKRL